MRGGFFRYFTQFIGRLPIRRIDFSKREEKAEHDRLVSLVEQVTTFHRQAAAAKSPPDKEALDRQIHAATRQIDEAVCALYGVKFAEIAGATEATK